MEERQGKQSFLAVLVIGSSNCTRVNSSNVRRVAYSFAILLLLTKMQQVQAAYKGGQTGEWGREKKQGENTVHMPHEMTLRARLRAC